MVYYHWFRVGDASECTEQALSEREPALLQSSDWPRVGLYGAQKWPLTAQLVVKTAQGWSMYPFCSFGWSSGPSCVDTGRVRSFARFFSTPFHTKRATFFDFGARCGACSARILGKFVLNVHSLCIRRRWGDFGGVWLPLLHFVSGAAAFRVVKGGECFCTSRCPGRVRYV